MTIHDDHIPTGFNIVCNRLERYLIEMPAACPYGQPHTAIFRQAMLSTFTEPVLEDLLAAGFRRNGNTIYAMACRTCHSCIPLRIDPLLFRPSRNQKRVLRKNRDLQATTGPLRITDERLELCNRFLHARYPGRYNSAEEYYAGFFLNTGFCTYEIAYRQGAKLIGVAVVDCGAHYVNAVYFYFDPAESRRSPGTFNILHLIDFCRQRNISYLYLGYWIEEVAAMCYKAKFKPHYLLRDNVWTKIDNNGPAVVEKNPHA